MIRRWLALTYYLYALRLAALSHFYFNPLYLPQVLQIYTAYWFYYIQMPIFLTLTFGLTGITEPPFSLAVNVLAVLMCYFAYRHGRRLKAATA